MQGQAACILGGGAGACPLTYKGRVKGFPSAWGEASLACCAQPPALGLGAPPPPPPSWPGPSPPHTWTAVLLQLLCVARPTPLPEDKPESWNDSLPFCPPFSPHAGHPPARGL